MQFATRPHLTSQPIKACRAARARMTAAAAAIALAACAAAAGPLASPAAASSTTIAATYEITFDGAWAYRATELSPGVMDAVRITDASWRSTATQPVTITRAGTQQTNVVPMASSAATFTGSYVENIHGIHPIQQVCALTLDGPPGEGLGGVSTDDEGTVTVDLQPVDHFAGTQKCKYPTPHTDIALLGRELATKVTFPADRLGEGSIVLPVANGPSQPCWSYALTTSCSATWSGTVTLTKLSSQDAPPPTPAPAPAPQPAGGQSTPPKPAPKPGKTKPGESTKPGKKGNTVPLADDWYQQEVPALIDDWFPGAIPPLVEQGSDEITPLVAPLVSPAADSRFEPSRGKLGFRAECSGGCSGTATLTTAGGSAESRKAARLAAGAARPVHHVTMRFSVDSGEHVVVLRLSKQARANLTQARRGALELALTDRDSHATTTALRVLRTRR